MLYTTLPFIFLYTNNLSLPIEYIIITIEFPVYYLKSIVQALGIKPWYSKLILLNEGTKCGYHRFIYSTNINCTSTSHNMKWKSYIKVTRV